ncbi:Holliday junction DNA helicase subunit RuvA [Melghirimyces profundicolus]|uniref:Holliday junction branch migration complex subunit RuvA n=1 Tax=Melghirimyces profundicolus TaxID=1242148 RepID=A0A2T6BH18_9BACL|nr:Holliday junction branch migration protein RuvA [Melghirimyces profundicolus]PTX55336.1 Holliday junction DNA helicase subunit RuvA [Melghirimyces profundicolus]
MIDYIRGKVVYHTLDAVVVEVKGVGYRIFCANPFEWGEGEEVRVYTHQVVREDAHLLYGFQDRVTRDLFRMLLEVSGIGPKVALSITAAGSPERLAEAVEQENLNVLTRLPGIGKKTAQRLVLDLKDKLRKAEWARPLSRSPEPAGRLSGEGRALEAIEALKALGYNEEEASRSVREAREGFGEREPGLDEWIKRALQLSMKG